MMSCCRLTGGWVGASFNELNRIELNEWIALALLCCCVSFTNQPASQPASRQHKRGMEGGSKCICRYDLPTYVVAGQFVNKGACLSHPILSYPSYINPPKECFISSIARTGLPFSPKDYFSLDLMFVSSP